MTMNTQNIIEDDARDDRKAWIGLLIACGALVGAALIAACSSHGSSTGTSDSSTGSSNSEAGTASVTRLSDNQRGGPSVGSIGSAAPANSSTSSTLDNPDTV